MSNKINLNVFNGVWALYHDSDIMSQLVWRNGNYEMVFSNNIFGKHGQGWVVRSISTLQQYFAVKTNGSPWQQGGQIIYSIILEDIPEGLDVSIVQFGNIILVDGFDEHNIYEFTCVHNGHINIKLAYLNVGDNTLISHTASLPEGLSLVNNQDGVYINGSILDESDQQFNITFSYNNGIQTVSKICTIKYHVLIPITFSSLQPNASVSLSYNSNDDIYYMINGVQNIYTSGTDIALTNIGDFVSFYSKSNTSSSSSASENNVPFQFSTGNGGKLKVSGSVNSLYNYDDSEVYYNSLFKNCTKLMEASQLELPSSNLSDYAFKSMFQGCSALSSIPILSASSLSKHCYEDMFKGCSSLNAMPVLPATNLEDNCYYGMFESCTSLSSVMPLTAPLLKFRCYSDMFKGCTSLTITPLLQAIYLNDYCCAGMFENCISLNQVTSLPIINIGDSSSSSSGENVFASNCYERMFYGCTSLVNAPLLPSIALTENCYAYMFYGCTSLIEAPYLPAVNLVNGCYNYMFYGCSQLNRMQVQFVDWNNGSSTLNWVYGVNASGKFTKHEQLDEIHDDSHIPNGWNIYDVESITRNMLIENMDDLEVVFNTSLKIDGLLDDEININE